MELFARIFSALRFKEEPTIEEVIKEAGWGSNRDIRQKGFRIDSNFSEESPFFSRRVKDMPKITDPKTIIQFGTAVLTPKGNKVIVVLKEDEDPYGFKKAIEYIKTEEGQKAIKKALEESAKIIEKRRKDGIITWKQLHTPFDI